MRKNIPQIITNHFQTQMEKQTQQPLTQEELMRLKTNITIIWKELSKTGLLLLAAIFLGVWSHVLVFMGCYVLYRVCFKGIYLNSSLACFIMGILTYGISILLSITITIPLYVKPLGKV